MTLRPTSKGKKKSRKQPEYANSASGNFTKQNPKLSQSVYSFFFLDSPPCILFSILSVHTQLPINELIPFLHRRPSHTQRIPNGEQVKRVSALFCYR